MTSTVLYIYTVYITREKTTSVLNLVGSKSFTVPFREEGDSRVFSSAFKQTAVEWKISVKMTWFKKKKYLLIKENTFLGKSDKYNMIYTQKAHKGSSNMICTQKALQIHVFDRSLFTQPQRTHSYVFSKCF